MRILIVGGGGREHALALAISKNPKVEKIYCLPGNGGIAQVAECAPIKSTDIPAVVDFAVKHGVDFAVVAQDDPLALGAVDRLHDQGIRCFGPTQAAAQIESSKVFSKDLMKKYGIPTARYEVFTDAEQAVSYARAQRYPLVVKADGLALGKGVIIAKAHEEAEQAIRGMLSGALFGTSGKRVVIEEFLEGPEVTVLSFTDGHTLIPMVSSMDHKRAGDGDTGLNTGGMGVIAPNPFYTPEIADRCMKEIFLPTLKAMNEEGRPFKGCLYFGLMLTKDGPKVIEYNCRFGDPEAQTVLPLLTSDLLTILEAVEDERLCEAPVTFSKGACCCVMLAAKGYPGSYEKGLPIDLKDAEALATVYHSGTKIENGRLCSNGGRVLGVSATADTLENAVKKSYEAVSRIDFPGGFCRGDIGKKALKAKEARHG